MYKKIKDYPQYRINKKGVVRRYPGYFGKPYNILKTSISRNGYVHISLCKNGKVKTFRVHRLIAEAFIPNPENKPQVNHIDGNRINNSLSNLEWVTRSENHLHAFRVTKNRKPPLNMLGKLGRDHNRSKSFWIEYTDNKIIKYESGLEFKRETGMDHTSISWARKKGNKSYKFKKRGKLKNLIVHFEIIV